MIFAVSKQEYLNIYELLGMCKDGFAGKQCYECASPNVFGPECKKPCNCNSEGSKDDACISTTGKCNCFTEYGGIKCDKKCLPGYYGDNCEQGTLKA